MHILAICQAKKKRKIFLKEKNEEEEAVHEIRVHSNLWEKNHAPCWKGQEDQISEEAKRFFSSSSESHDSSRTSPAALCRLPSFPIWRPNLRSANNCTWSKCSNQGRIPEDKTHPPTNNDWCFAGRRAIHNRWMMNGKPSTVEYRVPHEMNHNYVPIFNRALSYFDLSHSLGFRVFFHTFLGTFTRAWQRLHHLIHFCLICLQDFHLTAVDHVLRHANVWYCKRKCAFHYKIIKL